MPCGQFEQICCVVACLKHMKTCSPVAYVLNGGPTCLGVLSVGMLCRYVKTLEKTAEVANRKGQPDPEAVKKVCCYKLFPDCHSMPLCICSTSRP
jgi:hypothetical protein